MFWFYFKTRVSQLIKVEKSLRYLVVSSPPRVREAYI